MFVGYNKNKENDSPLRVDSGKLMTSALRSWEASVTEVLTSVPGVTSDPCMTFALAASSLCASSVTSD